MKFGLNDRKNLTGAGLYVIIFQAMSLLPLLYIFTATGYMGLLFKSSFLSVLCDFGFSAIPRAEALLLSYLYRITSSEVIIYFILILWALALGIAFKKLSIKSEKAGIIVRKAAMALIIIDLVVRCVPLDFNRSFGTAGFLFGLIIRAGCFVLILLDLKKKNK